MANTRPLTYYKPLMVKLEPSLKRKLRQAAADYETDMSKITRIALIEYLKNLPPREETATPDEVAVS